MIEVRELRANPERMREAIRMRRVDPKKADLDRWLALDGQLRDARQSLETLNAEKNKLAQLGKTDPNAARTRGQELRQQSREIEERLAGKRGRSAFIDEAVQQKVRQERFLRALKETAGTIRDEDHPEFADVPEYIHQRRLGEDRLRGLS